MLEKSGVLRPASPKGIPFEYVMQPCDVKLSYRSRPWFTVRLEVGHNEIGDADESEMISVPDVLADLFSYLGIPKPAALPMMKLEYQVAQKLHGATAPGSKRAHDLIDLQLIMANGDVDVGKVHDLCRKLFKYRRGHQWPPKAVKGDEWENIYAAQSREINVLPNVDEAVAWTNALIERIVNA